MKWFKQVCVAAMAGALSVGCGGGGGGSSSPAAPPTPTPMTNADFTGTYTLSALLASASTPVTIAGFGTATADGAGVGSTLSGGNDGSNVSTPTPGMFPFSVASDGALTLDTTVMGGLQRNGRGAVASTLTASNPPALYVLLRRSGTYSAATMTGDYHFGSLLLSSSSVGTSIWSTTANGKATFDGAGSYTYPTFNINQGGTVSSNSGANLAYAISAGGEVTMSTGGAQSVVGGVTSGGSFVVVSGGTTATDTPMLKILIKAGSGMTNSAFSGEYWVAGLYSDPTDSGNWLSFSGTVTADGAGNMNYVSTTENFEGAISPNSGPDTYTVGADGTLQSGDRIGAITQDGEFAFYSGSNATNGTPLLFVFMRKQ